MKINPSLFQLTKEIKSIGIFDVLVNLHPEVQSQIKIKTIPQEGKNNYTIFSPTVICICILEYIL